MVLRVGICVFGSVCKDTHIYTEKFNLCPSGPWVEMWGAEPREEMTKEEWLKVGKGNQA